MRYFFISYTYKVSDDALGFGNICLSCESFPSLDEIEMDIRQGVECESITVMSIQEFIEADYNNLISKSE